jgi:hypothetical protein
MQHRLPFDSHHWLFELWEPELRMRGLSATVEDLNRRRDLNAVENPRAVPAP